MDPRLVELMEEGAPADEAEVILKLHQHGPTPPSVRIVARFGDIVTARVRRDRLLATWQDPRIASVKAPRLVAAEAVPSGLAFSGTLGIAPVDHSALRRAGATGRGTCVAIVDWGLDIRHPNFRNSDGSTRVLALWDQANRRTSPSRYGYGAMFSRGEIDAALRTADPYAALDYHPADADPLGEGTHGTHVTDVAAGNGRAPGTVRGVAPEADIIFVHLAARGTGGLANLGDTSRILEALDFIAHVAGPRRWCVNLSVGKCGGPHTGRTLVEQGIDALLGAAPGRILSQSVGNYHDARVHSSGRLGLNDRRTLTWRTDSADLTPNELEIFYNTSDRFGIEVTAPGGAGRWSAPLGTRIAVVINGVERGRLYHRANDPVAQQHHIDFFLDPKAPAGPWTITLVGESIADGRFHAWVERDSACLTCQSRFDVADADPTTTTGTLANSATGITTGAYDPALPGRPIASFSSSGPTVQGEPRPHILAPGVEIPAARSALRVPSAFGSFVTTKSGTSQAAPHTTGTIACMLQSSSRPLWYHEVRALLAETATPVTDPAERDRSGSGYLMPAAAVDAARRLGTEQHRRSAPLVTVGAIPWQSAPALEGDNVMKTNGNDSDCGCDHSDEALAEMLETWPDMTPEEEDSPPDDDIEEAVKKRHVVLISGGPGLYHVATDPQHDQSWANYASPPLLLTDEADELKAFTASDEDVWWFVYKDAYDKRWADDVASTAKSRVDEVARVRDRGFTSYWDMITGKAKDRNWNLRALASAGDLYTKLATFRKRSISRVIYWGHAASDLWLTIGDDGTGRVAAPATSETLEHGAIPSNIKNRFQAGHTSRRHLFIGCNTKAFAEAWSAQYRVWTEGVDGWIHFKTINTTGGLPCLLDTATQIVYSSGTEDSSATPSMLFPACAPAAAVTTTTSGTPSTPDASPARTGGESVVEYAESLAGAGRSLASLLAGPYDVVARPRETLRASLRAGDVVLRIAPGERFHHVCVLASGDIASRTDARRRGWKTELASEGGYAIVIETGAIPHRVRDTFARRVLGPGRQVPANQFIVRPSHGVTARSSAPVNISGFPGRSLEPLTFDAETAATSVTFKVENRYGRFAAVDRVAGCTVELIAPVAPPPGGVGPPGPSLVATGVTDAQGQVRIDLDGVGDGEFELRVSPPDVSTRPVGPATAKPVGTTPVPSRIWRRFVARVTVAGTKVISSPHPDIEANGRQVKVGLQPVWMKSPSREARPTTVPLTHCVIHHTSGPRIKPALHQLTTKHDDPDDDSSAHYIIDADGAIVKLVADEEMSWHAGASNWEGRANVNQFSIGIELVNRTCDPYPEEQMRALLGLLHRIRTNHPGITVQNFIGHSDVALLKTHRLGRKSGDPGEHFDWPRLAASGFGITVAPTPLAADAYGGLFAAFPSVAITEEDNDAHHRYGERLRPGITANVIREIQNDLKCIGYFCPTNGTYDDLTARAVMVFQEHFVRPVTRNSQRVDAATARALRAVRSVVPRCLTPPPTPAAESFSAYEIQETIGLRDPEWSIAPDEYAPETAATSVHLVVENRYGHFQRAGETDVDFVGGCTIELVDLVALAFAGTGLGPAAVPIRTGVTNAQGRLTIDLDTVPDGNYLLRVSPASQSSVPVGPATTVTAPGVALPTRIWRPLDSMLSIAGTLVTASTRPEVTIAGRNITIALQPVWIRSANFSAGRTVGGVAQAITHCIVHHTNGTHNPAEMRRDLNELVVAARGGAHYLIGDDGSIVKLVREEDRAWHAGASIWDGVDDVNSFSVGIEISNHSGAYTNDQYDALIGLIGRIQAAHPGIVANNIIGHSDIATCPQPGSASADCLNANPRRLGRKSSDPGVDFDWPRLAAAGFGIAVAATPLAAGAYGGFFDAHPAGRLRDGDSDAAHRYGGVVRPAISGAVREIQDDLTCIGYFCPPDGSFGRQTRMAVMVFQEHFVRPPTAHGQDVDAATARAIKAVRNVKCPPPPPPPPALPPQPGST